MANGSQPLLSLVISHRSDRGDDVSHLLGALRFNHHRLAESEIPHEIVVVDVAGEVDEASQVERAIRANAGLSTEAFTTIVIDPRYFDAGNHIRFLANNIGIRRARGVFVMSIGVGLCLGRRVMHWVTGTKIETGVVYHAPKVDVRIDDWRRVGSWDAFEQPSRVTGKAGAVEASNFTLLDRESFHELKGFPEVGVSVSFAERIFESKARASGYPIRSLGAPVYGVHVNGVGYRQNAADEPLRHAERRVTYLNPDTWGLGAAPERRLTPRHSRLDFDWAAISPLVELSRVLPAL